MTQTESKKRTRHLPPDPEHSNAQAARSADAAVQAFIAETRTDKPDALKDLLCDLMHWADRNHFDFDTELLHGRAYYADETAATSEECWKGTRGDAVQNPDESSDKNKQLSPVPNPLADASNLATTLAALRLFQRTYEDHEAKDIYEAFPEHFAPVDGKQPEPLGTEDIDTLCEQLNANE